MRLCEFKSQIAFSVKCLFVELCLGNEATTCYAGTRRGSDMEFTKLKIKKGNLEFNYEHHDCVGIAICKGVVREM
jgi:hypothetical protein